MRQLAYAALCLLVACSNDATTPSGPANPDEAQFVTSDIGNFWKAYDAGGKDGSATAFQREYLDRASPGLKDFIQARSVTGQRLAQMVAAFPSYFAAVRGNTLRLDQDPTVLDRIRANYHTIESLYPAAVFPPVTFLIGRFTTGGTTAQSGMLIGTEFFAIDESTPLDELGAFQRANVHSVDSIAVIVAHEHTHVLQLAARKLATHANKTLLEQAIMEGSADFVGELVSGSHINGRVYAYGYAHESDLWNEFQLAMNGSDVSNWLYNQGSSSSRPGDLGYFIGYRITQAYYNKAPDKSAAIADIIRVDNATAFLSASGYAP